ncbi:uncharacterized protein [Paralichthys olivaceus]|uniref:uncharacterized protein n=1 Tax=Paralichthys olivaceus TaxID=8255 RepID=UPI003752FC63
MRTTSENSDATRGIYKPIKELFQLPVYEMSQQCCWHNISYKVQTAVMTELLRLQETNQLPSSVSGEDMMNLIEEESKASLRVRLWQFQLEDYKDPEFLPLLNLVWEVSNSLKRRDIEFEARQFLKSPKIIPPEFRNPSIISLAQKFSSLLKELQRQPLTAKHLGPREVVLEVVPKVLQGFWLPPEDTCLNMPSEHLSVLAVSLTRAVEDKVSKLLPSLLREVSFTRSIRDKLVQSIQDSVTQSFSRPVLMKKISCFASDLIKSITTIATKNICELFQPQISTKEPNCVAEEVKQEPHQESAFTPPPPAPVTPPAEPAVVLEDATIEKSDTTKGIYKPIKELFQMPVYEMSQQCCWHNISYIGQTAVMTELLRLQETNQLPSSVSGEDMMNLIEEESNASQRVQLWQFQLEDYKDPEFLPLLNLVWEVSNSLKRRDIEFEARQFLKSPKTIPPEFRNPSIISLAQNFSSLLKELQRQPLTAKHLGPREVVLEVVPKVLQGFWLPPEDTCLNMPSEHLSVLAVSLTKAVEDKVSKLLPSLLREVSFTRSTRDKLVQSIQDSVTQSFSRPVLMKKISCFASDLIKSITTIATKNICELFQPQISTKEPISFA